jgi:two-component system chemotaxis response regulator CheB
MIVDDSLIARTALRRMAESAGDLEVVAVAGTAQHALEVLAGEQVEVILLDLEMPGMSGLEALPKLIEAGRGARILVVSALTADGAEHTLAALSLGAADTLPKPDRRGFHDDYRKVLLGKIRELGRVASDALQADSPRSTAIALARPFPRKAPGALAIGASTGGVHALATFFGRLPRQLGIPIVVTQHLPPTFIPYFARQLSGVSARETLLAAEGMPVEPDRILIAPGHAHLAFSWQAGRLTVRLDHGPSASGCMPSVDPMFSSLAEEIGDRALGVVLTGMGRDGARGAARIVAAGGSILAQDEASSAVWGMPRAVAEAGLASAVLPPEDIADLVATSLGAATCR